MTAEEAVSTLEEVKRILSAKLEGVSAGPWKAKDGNERYVIEDGEGYDIIDEGGAGCIGEASIYGGFREEEDALLSAFSRVAVPALLKAIAAVLDNHTRSGFSSWTLVHDEADRHVIAVATELSVLLPGKVRS